MSLPEKYSKEEMERILQRALSKQHSNSANVSHEQLLDVGKELGLTERDIMRAIDEEMYLIAFENAKKEVIAKRRQEWRDHFAWYLGVNAITITTNAFLTGGRLTWALGTLLGWGIGMAIHTATTLFPKDKEITKAAKKLLRKREKQHELGA